MTFTTSGFEHFVEDVENKRQEEELLDKFDELTIARNREVISLGQAAVAAGEFTLGNVVGKTRATMSRHHDLMFELGIDRMPEMPQKDHYDLSSRRVIVTPDIALGLRQVSRGRIRGFWDDTKEFGVERALADHAVPKSLAISAYDLRNRVVRSGTVFLGPDSFSDPDPLFREEWQRSFFPLSRNELESEVEKRRIEANPRSYSADSDMTEKELIVSAGLNIRFNGLLDEVQQNIS